LKGFLDLVHKFYHLPALVDAAEEPSVFANQKTLNLKVNERNERTPFGLQSSSSPIKTSSLSVNS
jgi:hypothetical protein